MSDMLLALGRRSAARKVVKVLGLPLPLPQSLQRNLNPWEEQSLAGRVVVVGGDTKQAQTLREDLRNAGAVVHERPGEAPTTATNVLLYDARALQSPKELRALYQFFHDHIASLSRCGRVIVIGQRPRNNDSPARAAAMSALEGFSRSLGREIGRHGSTSHTVLAPPSATKHLLPVLRFLCSERSAYSSGQTLVIQTPKQKIAPVYQAPLAGKTAVVTGAARGIGAATATALAREGANVIALDRPSDDGALESLCAGIGAVALPCDITDPNAAEQLLRATPNGIDILLHNAGITRDKTLKKMSEQQWDQALDVNLGAVVELTESLRDHLNDNGRVLTLSSIAGIAGNMGQTNYAAAKAGLIGFVRQLAPTLAPRGITVNAVAPGFIETRLTSAIPLATREAGRRLSNLSQGGLPDDVAEVLTFLASPGAQGLQGQVWRVCGGGFIGA